MRVTIGLDFLRTAGNAEPIAHGQGRPRSRYRSADVRPGTRWRWFIQAATRQQITLTRRASSFKTSRLPKCSW